MEGTFSVGCMIFSKNIKVWPNIGCWWKSIPGIVGGRRLADEIPGLSQQRGTTAKSAKKQTYQIVFRRKCSVIISCSKPFLFLGQKSEKKYRLNRTWEQSLYKQGAHSFWSGFWSLSTNYHCFLFQGFDWSTLVVDWFDESCDFISASQAVSGGRMVSDWRVVISLGLIRSSDSSKAGL